MRWPWVTRKTMEREALAARQLQRQRLEVELQRARDLAKAEVRQVRAEVDDLIVESIQPFVRKWTFAEATMRGDRVQVTLFVPAQTIDDLERDPTIADYLGRTLGGQFAATLRHLRIVDMGYPRIGEPPPAPRRLW